MGDKEYATIPRTLLESITFLARALPIRSVPTFIELLVGAMITPAGLLPKPGWRSNPCVAGPPTTSGFSRGNGRGLHLGCNWPDWL